jgi:hypothetical protein
MNLSSPRRPLLLGLALTGAAGAAVAVTLAVASPSTPDTAPAAHAFAAGAAPSIAAAAASNPPPVTSPAPRVTSAARPVAAPATPTIISLDEARGIAARAGNGQADQVQADAGPAGISYDVSVTRTDGTDVEVIIDGHTGRILSIITDTQNRVDANAPDAQDGAG